MQSRFTAVPTQKNPSIRLRLPPRWLKRGISAPRPNELIERYGAEASTVLELRKEHPRARSRIPAGFPELAAQLRHTMRTEMVMHLEDFYLRRVPLQMAREDHGSALGRGARPQVWAEERGLTKAESDRELEQLRAEIARRSAWKRGCLNRNRRVLRRQTERRRYENCRAALALLSQRTVLPPLPLQKPPRTRRS